MDRWYRHIPAPVSHLSSLCVPTGLSTLFCLLILAIQLAIPVTQIWHVSVAHTPVAALSEQHQSDQPTGFRTHLKSHQGDEFNDPISCLVCQAFVSIHHVVDIPIQATTDIERSTCQLPLTRLIVSQTFLYSSASRAPPVFS
jgi:hypothetical protein